MEAADRIGVFLVDDNFVVRRGLRSALEQEKDIDILGEASTGQEALERLQTLRRDVILLDIRMPDMDGIGVAREITGQWPEARILVLTVLDDPAHLVQAMLAGAKGYLVYGQFSPEELVSAVRTVHVGGIIFSPSLAPTVLKLIQENPSAQTVQAPDSLTPREREVLAHVGAGRSNLEIAAALGIEEKTVKNHLNAIYSKLRFKNRYEAMAYLLHDQPRPEQSDDP